MGEIDKQSSGCLCCVPHRVQRPHLSVHARDAAIFGFSSRGRPFEGKAFLWRFTAKKPLTFRSMAFGPSGESRTHGLLNPIQARYQTALHPDVTHCDGYYYTPLNCQMSTFSFTKMQNDCFVPPGWAILNAYNSRFNLSANPPVRHSAVFSKFADFSVHKKAIDLSINGFWSEWRESNSRPLEPHSSALPNCATPGCHSKRQVLL